MVNSFTSWLLSPEKGASVESLEKALSESVLSRDVTSLQTQEERAEKIAEVALEKLNLSHLLKASWWHFRAKFKSLVIRWTISDYVEARKTEQVATLLQDRMKHNAQIESSSSLKERVRLLQNIHPENKIFTPDELRLFAFNEALNVAASGVLENHTDFYVSFAFNNPHQLRSDCTLECSYTTAMRIMKEESHSWEIRKYGSWKINEQTQQAVVQLIQNNFGLQEVDTTKLLKFIQSKGSLRERQKALAKIIGFESRKMSTFELRRLYRELSSSRSLNLSSLRYHSQADLVTPEILKKAEDAIAKDPANGLTKLKKEHQEILESTKLIYLAVKERPEILDQLSIEEKNLYSRLYTLTLTLEKGPWYAQNFNDEEVKTNVLKLRRECQIEKITPDVLDRLVKTIENRLENTKALDRSEQIILQYSQNLYLALRTKPSLIKEMSPTDRNVYVQLFNAWFLFHLKDLDEGLKKNLIPPSLDKDVALDYLQSAIDQAVAPSSLKAKELYMLVEAIKDKTIDQARFKELVDELLSNESWLDRQEERPFNVDYILEPDEEDLNEFADNYLKPMDMVQIKTGDGQDVAIWRKLASHYTGESPYRVCVHEGRTETILSTAEGLAEYLANSVAYQAKGLDEKTRATYQRRFQRQLQQQVVTRHSTPLSRTSADYARINDGELTIMHVYADEDRYSFVIAYDMQYQLGAIGGNDREPIVSVQQKETYTMSPESATSVAAGGTIHLHANRVQA